jgi:hypothetical protein
VNVAVDSDRATASTFTTTWLTAVLLPWALSRGALCVVTELASSLRARGAMAAFAVWDGGWYVGIAHSGYDFSVHGQTPYPFFPLLPWLLRAAEAVHPPPIAAGVVLNHLVFLLALWGVHDIARAHGTALEASLASWSLALFPGSAPLTLLYPCAIFLACSVWAFRALELRRDGVVATLAATAALVRPNGLVLAIAGAFAVLRDDRSWQRALRIALPAALAVALWMAWLWLQTGDPLIFVHAKAGWREVSLASLVAGVDPLPKLDLAPVAFAALVLALAWRRLPGAWMLFVALMLLPSFGLGVLGMPRYTAACFPLFVAAGIVLARLPRGARVALLGCSALALVYVARRIVSGEQMP